MRPRILYYQIQICNLYYIANTIYIYICIYINIYTYIMIYFITNSKLLCEIKESSVRAIKKKEAENHENSFCDHFIYIQFYN